MDVYNKLLSKLNDPEIQEKLLHAGVDRASLEADLKEFEALINKFETHFDSAIEEAQGLVNIDCQPGAINNAIQLLKPHSETLMKDAKEIRTFYIENLRPYVRQLMEYYKISPTPTP